MAVEFDYHKKDVEEMLLEVKKTLARRSWFKKTNNKSSRLIGTFYDIHFITT